MEKRRLRMFAGPNGSGKSTINSVISKNLLGYYLNPDEIEKEVNKNGYLDVRDLGLQMETNEIITFFENHPLTERSERGNFIDYISYIEKGFIDFANVGFDSYLSAILTDFLRHKFLEVGKSFTFETVMSSPDKIGILKKAQEQGYRTYLYYVATEDPQINLLRIGHRVNKGGHNVPNDKVISRYYRSLELLLEAIKYSNRAFIFDNSGENKLWIAEIIDGFEIKLQTENIPNWFQKYILEKL